MPELSDYAHLTSGKVRDLYQVDDELLLMVASDRISAFDHVLPTTIEDKGRILTAMSVFWFDLLADVIPNHIVSHDDPLIPAEVAGRALLVRKLEMIPIECVARGYLTGSGLADYQRTGSVCGQRLPAGLVESDALPTPIFTPAGKAEWGGHDENVTFEMVQELAGDELAQRLRGATLTIYNTAAQHAAGAGLILADTKFEFGLPYGDVGPLILGDEVLTPDSSRFWPAEGYRPGQVQPSFDKQYVRDWLTVESGWNPAGDEPPPELPDEVVTATRDRYIQAYEMVSGRSFGDWLA